MKKLLLVVCCLAGGLTLTIASFLINRITPSDIAQRTLATCQVALREARKGFPLSYIKLTPSVTSCNSVESVSILWKGNAKHKEYPLNFLADVIFWSGLTGLGTGYLVKKRRPRTELCYYGCMKTILITGGSDGLGKAVAARLAPNYKVIILSPTEDKLRKMAEELGCEYKVCDVRDYAQVEKVVGEVGMVDCLVNSAGLWVEGDLETSDPALIQKAVEVNTLGTIYATRAVLPAMKSQKSGRIFNVISQAGLYGKSGRAAYNASKWAVTGFTKSMQEELSGTGVAMTGLYPGKLNTDMFAKMGIEKSMHNALGTDEVAKIIEFLLGCNDTTFFPEVGFKHING